MKDRFFGSHELQVRQEEAVTVSSERTFGIVFAVFFAIIGGLSFYHDGDLWPHYTGVALAFLLLAYVAPKALTHLNWLWAKFGLLLHMVLSPLILMLLYYVFITPIGVLMRLTGKDPLRRRFDTDAKSYWIHRDPPGPEPETFKNQF